MTNDINNPAGSAGSAVTAVAATPTLDDISKQYFSPADLGKPETAATLNKVGSILASLGKTPVMNFDPAKGPAAGFGVAVLPITERQENRGNVVKAIGICQIPDPVTIANSEGGAEFINTSILRSVMARIMSALRTSAASLPATVTDFITVARGEGLETFRELAPAFVKVLKSKGFTIMNAQTLRQVFSSKAFAEEQFPKVSQDKWVFLIDLMISKAAEAKLSPAILEHWKTTRDQTMVAIGDDFDLEAFKDLA